MARFLIKTAGLESNPINLKLGANRIGRSEDNDFQIPHPTISSNHCEVVLRDDALLIRDLESTNGTFVNGKAIQEARLASGQTVRLGDVELLVEMTEAVVAIPKFSNAEIPAPPVVTKGGALLCSKHPKALATHRCTKCKEVMCDVCVHRLHRKGSKITLMLCPHCSNAVEPIGTTDTTRVRKKSLITRVTETVKLKLTGLIGR